LLSGLSPRLDVLLAAFEPPFSRSLLPALLPCLLPAFERSLLPALDPALLPSRDACLEPDDDFAGLTVTTLPFSSTFAIVFERWLDGRDETCEMLSLGATEPRSTREPSYRGRDFSFSEGAFDGALEGVLEGAFDAFDGVVEGAREAGSPMPAAEGAVELLEIPRIVTSETLVLELVRECVDFACPLGREITTSVGAINELTIVDAEGGFGSILLGECEEA
jgi:hypothetical protein